MLPPESIKWLLAREDPVEVGGHHVKPVEMAAAFFRHLRKEVAATIQTPSLDLTAITIPVHFPTRAGNNLKKLALWRGSK